MYVCMYVHNSLSKKFFDETNSIPFKPFLNDCIWRCKIMLRVFLKSKLIILYHVPVKRAIVGPIARFMPGNSVDWSEMGVRNFSVLLQGQTPIHQNIPKQ